VEAADNEAVVRFIEQSQGETLIAARVLERTKSDQPLLGEVVTTRTLEYGHPSGQLIEILADFMDRLEVLTEHSLQVAFGTAGERIYALLHPADLQ
jgi:hypothetical protein